MLTSSGQAANFFALYNICETGSHIVASSAIYGGTYNLLGVTMKKMGIDVTFVDQNLPEEELAKAFKPNTRAMFGETITNPTVSVLDIEKFARLAHSHGVPLIVDNTFATPVNCQPIKWGFISSTTILARPRRCSPKAVPWHGRSITTPGARFGMSVRGPLSAATTGSRRCP